MERRQLDPAVAVRCPYDGDVRSDAVQPDELVHPLALDGCLALQFQAQFDEERDLSREIGQATATSLALAGPLVKQIGFDG
ncbi:hypothetical protein [Streptomyces sp. NPDC058683]|uniref:hypothetical protein n=1 Tax=Streptomyces sp. NPDC058683 TaxID=3346597 RepID=UPI00364B1500